ncbi:LytTR family DNA-binding domain-containing protein [Mangrovibacterium marinum]|uniref:HTH LytTR-type domain-containing protein n=1 Tax=Mangrovibacterium marinum TaxID=1639118 RepID=A0A2T5C6R0_9BACT|nr:LytTR family DNA-binding domain-containing protein [Mangrovibacterium marinum]PTN10639.1 hypothetical protein C8N47_101289 [Mangrovibacterium marinum]
MTTNWKYKILLVEQNPTFAQAVKDTLQTFAGLYAFVGVRSKNELADHARESDYDLLMANVELIDWIRDTGHLQSKLVCFYRHQDFLDKHKALDQNCLSEFVSGLQGKLQGIPAIQHLLKPQSEPILPLWTLSGLELVRVSEVVSFQRDAQFPGIRSSWFVCLKSGDTKPLRRKSKAKDILSFLGNQMFIQVNQSTILNLMFVESIDYKRCCCVVKKPFQPTAVRLSRRRLSGLKKRFDRI